MGAWNRDILDCLYHEAKKTQVKYLRVSGSYVEPVRGRKKCEFGQDVRSAESLPQIVPSVGRKGQLLLASARCAHPRPCNAVAKPIGQCLYRSEGGNGNACWYARVPCISIKYSHSRIEVSFRKWVPCAGYDFGSKYSSLAPTSPSVSSVNTWHLDFVLCPTTILCKFISIVWLFLIGKVTFWHFSRDHFLTFHMGIVHEHLLQIV